MSEKNSKFDNLYYLKNNQSPEKKPNNILRKFIAGLAIATTLAGGGYLAYEKVIKPPVEVTPEFRMLDKNTIELFDGTVIELSKDTKTYRVKEGDGMDAVIYKIDGIGSIKHNDFDAIESYIENIPENSDIFHNNRNIEKDDTVVIPAEVDVVSKATLK
jgi:hypothetical protein